jgi:sugar O-acyltransferase (sialic acid O-acetyltransferase NeuD family)
MPGRELRQRSGMRHPLQQISAGQRVVIVGTGQWGATALEYLRYDTPHEVVAFTTEAAFVADPAYCGLPVVPLDELAKAYPPEEFRAFVAVSRAQLNRVRRRLFQTVKKAGYDCISYVCSQAFILPGTEVGENVFVQENASIEFGVRLGDGVYVGAGTCVGHHSVVEDDCTFGPLVAVGGNSMIGSASFFGAGCCVRDYTRIAPDCIVGAGAVVVKDTEPGKVYVGNPARPTARDSYDTFGVVSH